MPLPRAYVEADQLDLFDFERRLAMLIDGLAKQATDELHEMAERGRRRFGQLARRDYLHMPYPQR